MLQGGEVFLSEVTEASKPPAKVEQFAKAEVIIKLFFITQCVMVVLVSEVIHNFDL